VSSLGGARDLGALRPGAKTASGHYLEVAVLTAVVAAVAIPLYYYRHRLVAWMEGRTRPMMRPPARERPRGQELDIGDRTTYSRRALSSWEASKPVNGVGMGSAPGGWRYFYFPHVCPLALHELNRGATGRTSRPPVAM